MNLKRSLTGIALVTIMLLALCAVSASTSVSAANSGSVQAPAGSPIPAGSNPAVCSQNPNSLDLFVRGADNACWWRHWDGTAKWGAWQSLGGVLTSSPAAVSRQDGTVDVYVRGTNGAVYENYWNSAGWHTWGSLGGQVAANTGPAASGFRSDAYPLGREDVFVMGTNGALYQKTWTGSSSWGSWTSLGGQLTSSPSAANVSGGEEWVAVRGTNGACYYKYTTNDARSWSSWINLGGQILSGTGPGVNGITAFVTGTNHQVYWWDGAYWNSLGGNATSSPAVAERGTFAWDVFIRGSNGLIYWNERSGSSWSGWTPGMQGPP